MSQVIVLLFILISCLSGCHCYSILISIVCCVSSVMLCMCTGSSIPLSLTLITLKPFDMQTETGNDNSDDVVDRSDKARSHVCPECWKRYTTTSSMNRHIKSAHTGDNWYPCTRCQKRYSSQGALRQHLNIHTSRYKCTECGRCCKSSEDLAIHRRRHSGEKPYQCDVCGERFAVAHVLVVHNRMKHTEENPYSCHVCNKVFRRSECLSRHMIVHTREKPYKCEECGKAFGQSGNLYTHHRKYHMGDNPFRCMVCYRSFSDIDHLEKHQRCIPLALQSEDT